MNHNLRKLKEPDFYRHESDIFALAAAVESCTLPPSRWTYSARLTYLLWHLHMHSLLHARRMIRDGLRRYNFHHHIPETGNDVPALVRMVRGYLATNNESRSVVELANGLMRYCPSPSRRANTRDLTIDMSDSKWRDNYELARI